MGSSLSLSLPYFPLVYAPVCVLVYLCIVRCFLANYLMHFWLYQAARALANLAAHGDSNSNNAAVGQEAGALEALVQLTQSPHEGVR